MLKIEYVFYVVGIVFLFATIAYFAYQYVFDLADSIKAVILALMVVVAFVIGQTLQERGM